MAIRALNEFIPVQLFKNDGTINAGGSLEFYENLTLTPTDVYAESTLVTNLGDTITLDGAGRWLSSEVWLPTVVRVRCKDSLGNLLWSLDNINLDTAAAGTVSGGNLVTNGSFEIDSNADNLPDGWTLTAYTGATNTLDASTQSDGAKSLKSTSAGNGGGAWLHDAYIEIDDKAKYTADYDLRSSVAAANDVRIIVELLWYNAAKTQLGGGSAFTTLYDDASDNPATFTHFQNNVTPPSGARYCRPRVILCDPSDATAGSAWCDAFSLIKQPGALNLPGDFNAGGTTGASGDISPAQITANQNDYNPTGLSTASILRLNSDAARSITGLAGGSDGRIVTLLNIGAQLITLEDEDAGSTAANRFALAGDVVLLPDTALTLWYDATSSRWRAHHQPDEALGVRQTPQDLIGSRAAGTNYQNTTGKPIRVDVTTNQVGGTAVAGGTSASIKGYVGASNPANLLKSASHLALANFGSGDFTWIGSAHLLVPHGWWYRIDVAGAATLATWIETR